MIVVGSLAKQMEEGKKYTLVYSIDGKGIVHVDVVEVKEHE